MKARRHGWQRPLHPLQILGMGVYMFLVGAFYCFNGLFLGNKIAEIIICSIFAFVAVSVMFLFIRCVALDPTDKTRLRRKKKAKSQGGKKLNYGFLLRQIIMKSIRRIERKVLKNFIRRKYLGPLNNVQMVEALLPFPLVTEEDVDVQDPKEDDISFCSLCDFEVNQHSKHCRSCNRCVDGFDHHCKWLNNCVGKKNYTTFVLLMVFVLLMLVIEGGTSVAIFVRCFADKKGIEEELMRRHYAKFPRGLLAALSAVLVLVTAYGLAALGQLFLFHVVLIKKGLRTYEYIVAMKEEIKLDDLDFSDWSSSDDESIDEPESPRGEVTNFSEFVCGDERAKQSPGRLTISIEPESEATTTSTLNKKQKQQQQSGLQYQASIINPWRLLRISKTKALEVSEKAKEKLANQKQISNRDPNLSLYPLPSEVKNGPLMKPERKLSPLAFIGSPRRFSSPRRRFSGSPRTMFPYNRSNFDLKLTEVSRELDISKQVLSSVIKDGGDDDEASPRL